MGERRGRESRPTGKYGRFSPHRPHMGYIRTYIARGRAENGGQSIGQDVELSPRRASARGRGAKSAPRGQSPSRSCPRPELAAVPLLQHAGRALQAAGQDRASGCCLGQKIGEADGYRQRGRTRAGLGQGQGHPAALHRRGPPRIFGHSSKTTAWTSGIASKSSPVENADDPAQLLAAIRAAGVVGMGGAAFPTHVKLSPPKDKRYRHGHPQRRGVRAVFERRPPRDAGRGGRGGGRSAPGRADRRRAGAATSAWRTTSPTPPRACKRPRGADARVLARCSAKYPQGSEKQLIQALTGRRVPSGRPADGRGLRGGQRLHRRRHLPGRARGPAAHRARAHRGRRWWGRRKNLRARIGTEIGAARRLSAGERGRKAWTRSSSAGR